MLGDLTLPDYYNRTLQSEPSSFYEPSIAVPDLVVYAVGGNDYVSQGGNFPPSDEFITANINFFLQILERAPNAQILAVCGMGDPVETESKPLNSRCLSCPFTEQAV